MWYHGTVMNRINPIEQQFLDYMAQLQGRHLDLVRGHYLTLRKHFRPHGNRFRQLSEEFIRLHDFYYNIDHPTDYIKLYQQHAGISLFRFLSYADHRPSLLGNAAYFFKLLVGGQAARACCSLRREVKKKLHRKKAPGVIELAGRRFQKVVLLDYGCGLAYRSIETAQALGDRLDRLVLVDIPSLVLDFTCHRAERLGLRVERIEVTPEQPYPQLPEHHICFANEVVEHVKEPLRLLARLSSAQPGGALLCGDYDDHCPEIYHLHTDLSSFRRELARDYRPLGGDWYEKG